MPDRKNTKALIMFSLDEDNQFYIDVEIKDYSEDTLDKLSLLTASIASDSFDQQTIEMLRIAFEQDGKGKEFTSFLSQALLKKTILTGKEILEDMDLDEEEGDGDLPIIKPTDLL